MTSKKAPAKKDELAAERKRASRVILLTEKALKKHLHLIKKRERLTSVVAALERLRGARNGTDILQMRESIQKLNELTAGFAAWALKGPRR